MSIFPYSRNIAICNFKLKTLIFFLYSFCCKETVDSQDWDPLKKQGCCIEWPYKELCWVYLYVCVYNVCPILEGFLPTVTATQLYTQKWGREALQMAAFPRLIVPSKGYENPNRKHYLPLRRGHWSKGELNLYGFLLYSLLLGFC